jgi:hypothetical protein
VVECLATSHGGADWYWSAANAGIAAGHAAIDNLHVQQQLAKDNQRPN